MKDNQGFSIMLLAVSYCCRNNVQADRCAGSLNVPEILLYVRLQEHECIGDVRGSGLMLGIEIVQSKASRLPAPAAASHIKEAMLGLRVLMTVDGPNANVLKIKPPMVFAEPDADRMLSVFKQVRKRRKLIRLWWTRGHDRGTSMLRKRRLGP